MRRFSAHAGFTLLEVLIASTLLAVMMTLILGSLRIGVTSWSTGEHRSEIINRMLVTTNFLRTHVSAALPLFLPPARGKFGGDGAALRPQFLFRGERGWMQYAGTLPPQVKGGLYRFDLHWVQSSERSDLRLTIWPLVSGEPGKDPQPIDDVTILENVDTFSLAYYKLEPDGKAQWLDVWNEEVMPALVRIDLSVRDEPAWPPLFIAPRPEVRR